MLNKLVEGRLYLVRSLLRRDLVGDLPLGVAEVNRGIIRANLVHFNQFKVERAIKNNDPTLS